VEGVAGGEVIQPSILEPTMNANPTPYLIVVTVPAGPSTHAVLAPTSTNVPWVGQSFKLHPGQNYIGREPAPDIVIVLPWQSVSRRHALIEMTALDAWEIVDQQSRNGVFLNGTRLPLNAPTPLCNGDRIRITDVEFEFSFQLEPNAIPTVASDTATQRNLTV